MNWQVYQLFYSYLYHLECGLKLWDNDLVSFEILRRKKHQDIFHHFEGDRIRNRDGLYNPDSLGKFIDDVICDVLQDSKGVLYVRLLYTLQKPEYKKWIQNRGIK